MHADHTEPAANRKVPNVPSLPGFAFAICAAALPIFYSADAGVRLDALRALQTALPCIDDVSAPGAGSMADADANTDPYAQLRGGGVGTDTDAAALVNKRMQHLLDRVDQLLNARAGPYALVMPDDYTGVDEAPGLVAALSTDLLFHAALVSVLTASPLVTCSTDNDRGVVSVVTAYELGNATMAAVKYICGSATASDVLSTGCLDRLHVLLAAANPSALKDLLEQRECLRATTRLETAMAETTRAFHLARARASPSCWQEFGRLALGTAGAADEVASCQVKTFPEAVFDLSAVAHDLSLAVTHLAKVSGVSGAGAGAGAGDDSFADKSGVIADAACTLLATAVLCGSEHALASALAAVSALMRACGLSARANILEALGGRFFEEQPSSDADRALVARVQFELASPAVLCEVLFLGVLFGDGDADADGSTGHDKVAAANCHIFATDLLDAALYTYTGALGAGGGDADFKDRVRVDEDAWAALVPALTVCAWAGASRQAAPMVAALTRLAGLGDNATLVLGLLHSSANVRSEAALALWTAGRTCAPALVPATARSAAGAGVSGSITGDPFRGNAALSAARVTARAAAAAATAEGVSGGRDGDGRRSRNTGLDVYKLVGLAFPTDLSTTTDTIRMSALRQLRYVVGDGVGVSTATCEDVTLACLGVVETVLTTGALWDKLSLEVLLLLAVTLASPSAYNARTALMGGMTTTRAGASGSSPADASMSLWPLVSLVLKSAPTAAAPDAPLSAQAQAVALATFALATCVLDRSSPAWSAACDAVTFSTAHEGGVGTVAVPSFLADYCLVSLAGVPTSVALDASALPAVEVAVMEAVCPTPAASATATNNTDGTACGSSVLSLDDVRDIVGRANDGGAAGLPREGAVALARAVCKAAAGAKSHAALRATLTHTRCLLATTPALALELVGGGPDGSIGTALSRVLQTAPRTPVDLVTLSVVLDSLSAVLEGLADTGDAAAVAAGTRAVTQCIGGVVFRLLAYHGTDSGAHTFKPPQGVARSEKQYVAWASEVEGARHACLRTLLALLSSIATTPAGLEALCDKVCAYSHRLP